MPAQVEQRGPKTEIDARNVEALTAAYDRDGFVNGGRVLSDSELSGLAEDLERLAEPIMRRAKSEAPAAAGEQWGAEHFLIKSPRAHSPRFEAVLNCKPMLALAAALAKTRLIQLWSDAVHYKAPLTGGTADWHQDGPYYYGVKPMQRTISAWIALDDADEESGCMWMAPGSHRWGNKEEYLRKLKRRGALASFQALERPNGVPADEWRGIAPCPVQRGEVHFHHPFTWHGSPPNRGPRPRRAYSLFLLTGDVRAGENNDLGLPVGAYVRGAADKPILYRAGRSPA